MSRNTTIRDRHRAIIRKGEPPCYHCGQPIDYSAKYPEPMSFVVDHLIAIANGGTDTLANKVAAHQSCNRAKSDKPYAPVVRRSQSLNW